MMSFPVWFTDKMHNIGYKAPSHISASNLEWITFTDLSDTGKFSVIYIKMAIDLDIIRGFFQTHNQPVLFVVDSILVTDITVDEPWLRAIHALYYGRIYVWDGVGVSVIHHDKLNDRFHRSGYIVISKIVFETVDCWYPGFPGTFKVAMLGDKVFWKTEAKKDKPPPRQKDTSYEDFWKQEFKTWSERVHNTPYDTEPNPNKQRAEDVFRDFREAYERNKRAYEQHNPPPPRYVPKGDQWFNLLIAEGTLEGAKKKYRQLALEHHPDRAGDSPEVIQTMQLINAAYEKVKEYLT